MATSITVRPSKSVKEKPCGKDSDMIQRGSDSVKVNDELLLIYNGITNMWCCSRHDILTGTGRWSRKIILDLIIGGAYLVIGDSLKLSIWTKGMLLNQTDGNGRYR